VPQWFLPHNLQKYGKRFLLKIPLGFFLSCKVKSWNWNYSQIKFFNVKIQFYLFSQHPLPGCTVSHPSLLYFLPNSINSRKEETNNTNGYFEERSYLVFAVLIQNERKPNCNGHLSSRSLGLFKIQQTWFLHSFF